MFKFLPFISVSDITNAIFDAIVKPISSGVQKVLEVVLYPLLNKLIELLSPLFLSVVEPIIKIIWTIVLGWFHIRFFHWFVALLKVVDILEEGFNLFGGLQDVTIRTASGTKKDFLLNVFFNNTGVSKIFWGLTLVAFAISMIFGIITVAKSSIDLDGKRPVGKALGSLAKTGLTFLMVPFFMLFALNMTNVVIKKTSEIMSLNMGGSPTSLGTVLFLSMTLEADKDGNDSGWDQSKIAEELQNNMNSPNYDNQIASGFKDGARASYYSGAKKYWDFTQVSKDFNIARVKVFLGMGVAIFMIFMLISCSFVFITRIFEVLLLYIASPFFVASIPLDDGEKFREWQNMFIAKLCSGFGMLIGMKLYMLVVPIAMSSDLIFSKYTAVDNGLKIILVLGGAVAIYKSNSLLMQILNVQASYGESAAAATGAGAAFWLKNKGMAGIKSGFGMLGSKLGKGRNGLAGATAGVGGGLSGKNKGPNKFNRMLFGSRGAGDVLGLGNKNPNLGGALKTAALDYGKRKGKAIGHSIAKTARKLPGVEGAIGKFNKMEASYNKFSKKVSDAGGMSSYAFSKAKGYIGKVPGGKTVLKAGQSISNFAHRVDAKATSIKKELSTSGAVGYAINHTINKHSSGGDSSGIQTRPRSMGGTPPRMEPPKVTGEVETRPRSTGAKPPKMDPPKGTGSKHS